MLWAIFDFYPKFAQMAEIAQSRRVVLKGADAYNSDTWYSLNTISEGGLSLETDAV